MNRARTALALCLVAVAVGAAALRLPRLSARIMHGDEANQAVKTAILLETGRYRYDPNDHHGPSLYYLALPVLWAAGAERAPDISDGMLRLVPALFGVATVLLAFGLAGGLGRGAAVAAAVLACLSPALVYYSRYYVQEMLLVCFTGALLVAGFRYAATRRLRWAVAAGLALGLMHATKETWVLAGAAMAAALVLVVLWERRSGGPEAVGASEPLLSVRAVAAVLGPAVLVAVVLYTSFFTNWRGPLDSVLTYGYNLSKAGGEGLHAHPPWWYLAALAYSPLVTEVWAGPWWSEGLVLGLAVAGLVAAVTGRGLGEASRPLVRFLALYTVLVTAAYAVVPYKTPWCAATFLHAMTLLGGVGAAALVRWVPTRPLKGLLVLVLAAGAVHLGWQAHRAAFRFAVDQRNPYVYAHTSPDVARLVRRVEEAAEVAPKDEPFIIKVITRENYWPLPWYFRGFDQDLVGYYHQVPEDCDASVLVVSAAWAEAVAARTRAEYNRQCTYGLRPGVLVSVWIRRPLWDALVAKWTAKPTPPPPRGGT